MLSAEIAALRRIGQPADFDGGRCAYAFGYGFGEGMPDDPKYDFEIVLERNELVCTIDIYSALNPTPPDFDVDAWEAQKIHIRTPATRGAYQALQSAARAILKGFGVVVGRTLIRVKELAQ